MFPGEVSRAGPAGFAGPCTGARPSAAGMQISLGAPCVCEPRTPPGGGGGGGSLRPRGHAQASVSGEVGCGSRDAASRVTHSKALHRLVRRGTQLQLPG